MNSTARPLRIGYMPLTDAAALVMAVERGFDRRHGIAIELSRESSWASVRDKLRSGALDAAHALYGMVCGVELGIGAPPQAMAVLMNLSQNGQAITLSKVLAERGQVSGAQGYSFAHTFPTGNHAMLLYYWLAALGVDPLRDVRTLTVPPPQMVANLRAGTIDGFCVGEPWGERAVQDGIGVTAVTSQQIWPDHPGKVLGATAAWVDANRDSARALVAALLDASRWIDASEANKRATAEAMAQAGVLATPYASIAPRLLGHYEDGLGKRWDDPNALAFFRAGSVNFPYLSDAMWFMTQHRRWGLLSQDPDYRAVAERLCRIDVYQEAARLVGVELPATALRSSTLCDGVLWDGSDPAGYAASFPIRS
ncbi:CmpA/NrtA family ABC transporter substrate-binding protein [Massilia sp. CF038]|uniref:CmpA/NrtA family ABC transporter substrate-binding protein n=1 Tax=Massilia sp. CF038 TaxID=1881045 RepID=UPI0009185407|nr:CmpA/NrtA family ABC transporter substrate-binding protein [Massilia sp. CF038]SHG66728.1 nitrate/nitrite transport system substrate-binding protein [Massilia sp. CF038]